ncbi:MAG TPA: ribonuclease H-like domain-containing protein [Vulgatibacter sp.]
MGANPVPDEVLVFDLETQRAFAEVEPGGADALGLSLAVVWSYQREEFTTYLEAEAGALIDRLSGAALVVGFNHERFDLEVLRPYAGGRSIDSIRTFDLLPDLEKRLGHRVSLESCCRATFGSSKAGDGLLAIEWYRAGRMAELEHYCREDVRLTRDLFDRGRSSGAIAVRKRDRSGGWYTATVPVDWALPSPALAS